VRLVTARLAAILGCMVCVACSGGGSSTDTSTSGPQTRRYADAGALLSAMNAGGVTCQPRSAQDKGVLADSARHGTVIFCKEPDGNGVVIAVWLDSAGQADAYQAVGRSTAVVGQNWLVSVSGKTGDGKHAGPIRKVIGGKITDLDG
jgi:hypothetical protein